MKAAKNKSKINALFHCNVQRKAYNCIMAIINPNKGKSMTTLENVVSVLNATPNGANVILEWERPVKTLKTHSDLNIRKHVRMVGRKGIEYNNMKAVQEKRENGELPSEPKPTWFYHDENVKGLIRNKRTDEPYVQLFVGTSNKTRPSVSFTMDGEETTMEEIESFILASEKQSEKGETFTCKIENMIRIHRELENDFNVNQETSENEENEETENA